MAKSKTADKKKTEVKAIKTKKTIVTKPTNSSKSSKSTSTKTTKTSTKSSTKKSVNPATNKAAVKKPAKKIVKGEIEEIKPTTKTKKVETKKKTTTKRGSSLSAYKNIHVDRTVEGDEEGELVTAGAANGKAKITIVLPFDTKNMKFLDSKDLLKILKEVKKLLIKVRVFCNARCC